MEPKRWARYRSSNEVWDLVFTNDPPLSHFTVGGQRWLRTAVTEHWYATADEAKRELDEREND
jgi:hypothetical protein